MGLTYVLSMVVSTLKRMSMIAVGSNPKRALAHGARGVAEGSRPALLTRGGAEFTWRPTFRLDFTSQILVVKSHTGVYPSVSG